MKVRFRQTGGFAGLSFGCDLDTDALAPREASQLRGLVEKARQARPRATGAQRGRDLAHYEIAIEDAGATATVAFDDAQVPKAAAGLLEFLRARAARTPIA